MELFILCIILAAVFSLGYWLGKKNAPTAVAGVKSYLQNEFKTEWEAYKKGVKEGYETGLRDGQNHEPS